MPIVANTALPSFERFQKEGGDVLTPGQAHSQKSRELHIGLMNNMPDAALESTERQFLRLIPILTSGNYSGRLGSGAYCTPLF